MNITPADIANDERLSGYDHVGYFRSGVAKPFHAQVYGGKNNKAGHAWQGPGRRTALEAAQDYCDYVNSGGHVAIVAQLKSAGHQERRDAVAIDAEEAAALGVLRDKRAQRTSGKKGYVYCITDGTAVKIGYSLKPEARVAELQTGNPRLLRLAAKKPGGLNDEKALHVKYLHLNLLQEWFRPTKALLSEFGLTKEDVLS